MSKKAAHRRIVVFEYDPWLLWGVLGMVLLLFAGVGATVMSGAERFGAWRWISSIGQHQELVAELALRDKQIKMLKQQNTSLRVVLDVEQKAQRGLEERMARIEGEKAELLDDIAFYDRLMNPEIGRARLAFLEPKIDVIGAMNTYSYQFVVHQLANRYRSVNGSLSVEVVGVEDGDQRAIPLHALSMDVEPEIALGFRYYQAIDGVLLLPENFSPHTIRMRASGRHKGRRSQAITAEQAFSWNGGDS